MFIGLHICQKQLMDLELVELPSNYKVKFNRYKHQVILFGMSLIMFGVFLYFVFLSFWAESLALSILRKDKLLLLKLKIWEGMILLKLLKLSINLDFWLLDMNLIQLNTFTNKIAVIFKNRKNDTLLFI